MDRNVDGVWCGTAVATATSKTSTLARELEEAARQGFRAVGMTVGKTAMGGSELVVVTRRPVK